MSVCGICLKVPFFFLKSVLDDCFLFAKVLTASRVQSDKRDIPTLGSLQHFYYVQNCAEISRSLE